MWNLLIGPISNLISPIINKLFPDPIKQQEAQAQFMTEMMKLDVSTFESQIKPLLAELQGNWLQRSWRPILMLSIVAIVVNNYIVYPYLSLFSIKATILELPSQLWSLMEIGVGGYIVGRSAEKMAGAWKAGGK